MMSKEYLEALARNIRYKKEHIGNDTYRLYIKKNDVELLEQALQRLESIDNAIPSEALECLEDIYRNGIFISDYDALGKQHPTNISPETNKSISEQCDTIKRALLKAQEQEKENELLKEIIKSLFDRGCPLHQYTDKKGVLQIEVDDECSIMRLGEYKGVDLDKKLKEVLE